MSGSTAAEPRFGARSIGVLHSACYRAEANHATVVGTEHLLSAILLRARWDPPTWQAVQRSLAERDRSRSASEPALETSGVPASPADIEVMGTLREAAVLRPRRRAASTVPLRWHPEARAALELALATAGQATVAHVGPQYLLDAVLADDHGGARDLLRACRVDLPALRKAVRAGGRIPERDDPWRTTVGSLEAVGVLHPSALPPPPDPELAGLRRMAYALARGVARLSRVDPMQTALEMESARQAVRLGRTAVHTGHLLLATIELERNLQAVGVSLPDPLPTVNRAGSTLSEHRIEYYPAALALFGPDLPEEPLASPERRPKGRPGRRWRRRTNPSGLSWTVTAHEAADRALAAAASRGTRAGSSYLLIAALAEPEGIASELVRRLGADPAAVADHAAGPLPMS